MKILLTAAAVILVTTQSVCGTWTPAGNRIMTRWGKAVTPENAWREYPRVQMQRADWKNLNGLWQYAITDFNAAEPKTFEGDILVPYAVESALSGVGRKFLPDQKLWYKTTFAVDKSWKGRDIVLHFEAVDWISTLYVNGRVVGTHTGGSDPFSYNITPYLKASGEQTIVLAVTDPTCSGNQARGKQQLDQKGIWYTPVSGIWQTVWLEPVGKSAFESVVPQTDIHKKEVRFNTTLKGAKPTDRISIRVFDKGQVIKTAEFAASDPLVLLLPEAELWSPSSPKLYHFDLMLSRGGKPLDRISSYFAMRKVSIMKDAFGNNRMALNDRILFHYGTLDQGWWPDGLLTPPSAEAMRWDLEQLKAMGFNCLRKHIKVEPSRYYYDADSLGLMIWQDMPSGFAVAKAAEAHVKANSTSDWSRPSDSAVQWEKELKAMMDHLRFFPCIVTWVVFNEGWGQYDTRRVVEWVQHYDSTRLIDGVSGWADRGVGNMYDVHNYPVTAMQPLTKIGDRVSVLGEFGGLGMPVKDHQWNTNMRNWGYKNFDQSIVLVNDYLKLIYDLEALVKAGLSGAIYTQTTDVEGEVNGLITYDREVVKFPVSLLHAAHSRLYAVEPARERMLVADTRIVSNKKPVALGKLLSDKGVQFTEMSMPASSNGVKTACSRMNFTVNELPKTLSLYLYMCDKGRVWINGHLVLSNNELRLTRSYNHFNLSDYIDCLRVGENTIEVESEALPKNDLQLDYALYAF